MVSLITLTTSWWSPTHTRLSGKYALSPEGATTAGVLDYYKELDGPKPRLTFLGVTLDCARTSLELPEDKLNDFHHDIYAMYTRRTCTKRQLQMLAGKLSWCTQCLISGVIT